MGQPFSDTNATDMCHSYLGAGRARAHQSFTTCGKRFLTFSPPGAHTGIKPGATTHCRGSTPCLAALKGDPHHLKNITVISDNEESSLIVLRQVQL